MYFNYPEIENTLGRLQADITAAESHGCLCGLLCSEKSTNQREHWIARTAPNYNHDDLLQREARDQLDKLYSTTIQQLNDPTCDFQLLLPDDEDHIQDRVDALAQWCQGFIMGLKLGGISELSQLPGNAAEVSQDIVEIAQACSYELDDQGDSEEDENALEELVQYVRLGVLLLNEELHPSKTPPQTPTELH